MSSASRRILLLALYQFLGSVLRVLPPQNKLLLTSFNKKMISASWRIFFVFISKTSLRYFDCLPLNMAVLCHSTGKWSARRGASFVSDIAKLSTVFRPFTPQNGRLVMSFNRKNDQRIAAHLFCSHISVFPRVSWISYRAAFTFASCRFVFRFNSSISLWSSYPL